MAGKTLVCNFVMSGDIRYQNTSSLARRSDEDSFDIFLWPYVSSSTERGRLNQLAEKLGKAGVEWLFQKGGKWFFSTPAFRRQLPDFPLDAWVDGIFKVSVEFVQRRRTQFGEERDEKFFAISIIEDDVRNSRQAIFLSHRSSDKPKVRKYYEALRAMGLRPWFDAEDLSAGSHLERRLLSAFEESCAAVFFITSNYVDERYLAIEVDYAVNEKRKKGESFQIISLRFASEGGEVPQIPALLQTYVWKDVADDITGITEVVRGLPFELSIGDWRHAAR